MESKLNRLLAQHLCYDNPTRVRADVMELLYQLKSLSPKSGELIHNNGTESKLLTLSGTVPITYNRATYNIPVEIFISEPYPKRAPVCYVRPTSTMSVKPGHRHVDTQGLVYLPYLNEWDERTSSLTQLCIVMINVFGNEPPVWAKPAGGEAKSPVSRPAMDRPPSYNTVTPSASSSTNTRTTPPYGKSYGTPKQQAISAMTERLQAELKVFYTNVCSEVDTEYVKQHKLKSGHDEIESNMEKLRSTQGTLREQIEVARTSEVELDTWLASRSSAEDAPVDFDELIQPRDACSNKMLDLVAEAGAIEDALYALDRALSQGNIELSEFLREVRKLSRKQFLCYAHIKKILAAQQG